MLALQVTLTTSPGLLMISAGAGDTLKLGPALACKTEYKTDGSVISHLNILRIFNNNNRHSLFSYLSAGWNNNTDWSPIETSKDHQTNTELDIDCLLKLFLKEDQD